jgi:hypothetical protein
MAIVFDMIQCAFCFGYMARAVYVKMLENFVRKIDKHGKEIEPEGYSKSCSLTTDFMVIICFLLKFYFSL